MRASIALPARMHPLRRVLELFGNGPAEEREDFSQADLSATFATISLPSAEALLTALRGVMWGDRFQLSVTIGEGEAESLLSAQPETTRAFLRRLADPLSVLGNTVVCRVRFNIQKECEDGRLAIYFPTPFFQHLSTLQLKEALAGFDRLLRSSDQCTFACSDPIKPFGSKTLLFGPAETSPLVPDEVPNRREILARRAEVCHFADASSCRLIPDDFRLIERSDDEAINAVFDRICLVLSLSFAADISSLQGEDGLAYKLKGYKTFESETSGRGAPVDAPEEYFRIYRWIYGGGPVTDKAGLARNLLSLHIRGDDVFDLKPGAFASVCSGYDLYLRQNVKQYLEIKNKLADQLGSTSREMMKAVQSLGDALRTNFLAFASFFVTVVVVRVATSKELVGAFPVPLAVTAFVLLAGSFVYLLGSTALLRKEQARLEQSYANLRTRYTDLLSPADLDMIAAANAEELSQVQSYVAERRNLLVGIWSAHLLLFAVLVVFLMPPFPRQQSATGAAAASPSPVPAALRQAPVSPRPAPTPVP